MNVQTAEQPRKTRAQVMRDKVVIRLASNECGPMIEQLLKENDIYFPDADWTNIAPHWLIATVEDDVIGCIHVLPAKPFGYLEFMFVKPSVSFKLRAIAIYKLCMQGKATLTVAGCSYMLSSVEKKNSKFSNILKKHGMNPVAEADVFCKRLITGRMQ